MKKLLVIAVALAAVNAEATRARVTALGNSAHLIDTQTVYTNPADIFSLGGDYVTLESGTGVSTNSTDGAEGMVVRTMGDAKLGLSLGHDSANASTWGLRNTASGNFGNQQNPVEFTYGAKAGDMAWAGTLVYSNFADKSPTPVGVEKESSLGLRVGARTGMWDASLGLGLTNSAQFLNANKYTGTLGLSARGGYQMDSVYLFGGLTSNGYKVEDNAGAELRKWSRNTLNVGALTSVKKDGTEVFYSVQLAQAETKETVGDTKTTTMTAPIAIGVEADAASWLVLRGSITQTLQLVNSTKTTTGTVTNTEQSPAANDTALAAGAGLKFNKVNVDGTILVNGNQTINANNMLATVGMSYWF